MRLYPGLRVVLAITSSLLIISGCSSDGDERRQAYLDADYYTRLELPPDLTEPPATQQLSVPKPTDDALAQFKQDSKDVGKKKDDTETPEEPKPQSASETEIEPPVVLPKLKDVEIKTEGGVSWLEVNANEEKLWPQLSAFWSHEGIKVVQNKPLLGMMETDWVNKLQIDENAGWFERTFANLEPDKLDKFRMRVEPVTGVDKSRVYVTHSGMEVVVQGEDVSWRTRCTEQELENEILSRLALFLGLDESQAKTAFANYKPFASRVKIPEDDVSTLYITGDMEFVWKRTLRALDRLGVNIEETDTGSHRIHVAIAKLNREKSGEERDELAESSWLMQWLTGDGDADNPDRKFLIDLAQKDGVIKLSILNRDAEAVESVLAEQLRKGLAIELQ